MSTGSAVVTFMGQCQKDIISLHYWRPADDEFCLWKLFPLSISQNLRVILFCFFFSQHLCDQVQSHLNKLHLCDQNHQNFTVSSSPATMEEAALISDMLLSDADVRWTPGEGPFNFPGSPIDAFVHSNVPKKTLLPLYRLYWQYYLRSIRSQLCSSPVLMSRQASSSTPSHCQWPQLHWLWGLHGLALISASNFPNQRTDPLAEWSLSWQSLGFFDNACFIHGLF